MNLLSNLLEFSHNQPSSLMFCESPKELNLDKNTKQLRNMMSARKDVASTPERRTSSKSLSKIDLLSFSNTKIDPRQRLLHRMVHKLSMKCRKYYYNFFVVLENLQKKNITLYPQAKQKQQENPKIEMGFAKISQLHEILFSKYFSNMLKRSAFQVIVQWGRRKHALTKISKIIDKKIIHQSFKAIQQFSRNVEKKEIQLDILIDSIHHIDRSITNYYRISYLQTFMGRLKANLDHFRASVKRAQFQQFKTPPKVKVESENISVQPFSGAHSPFSKQKTTNLVNSIQQSYQNLKTRKKLSDESPGKPKEPLILLCEQVKLKMEKCLNYLKNRQCKAILNQPTLPFKFNKQKQYQICKRCEPIALNSHEVPDLNDRGTIFFHQIFSNIPMSHSRDIAESSVKIFSKKDSISETFSQELHSNSQVTLIAPLSEKYYEEPKKTISSSGVKGSAFGSEAVNFKNSLVVERELMKEQQVERFRQKKEMNFAKIKNQVKNEKRAHDEFFQTQSRFKGDNRCDSAERDYNSLKFRRQSDLCISLPQGLVIQSANSSSRQTPFIKRNSETPEPDSYRNNYVSERKHLSLMNNNKVQLLQEDGKKNAGATYLKILSKK